MTHFIHSLFHFMDSLTLLLNTSVLIHPELWDGSAIGAEWVRADDCRLAIAGQAGG